MSSPDKPDLARGWLRAEKLIEEEADRLAEMSDEEFEREAAAMPDPEPIPTKAELKTGSGQRVAQGSPSGSNAAPPAVVKRLPRRRSFVWLVAAALGAVLVLLVVERDEIVALFRPEPVAPVPTPQKPPDVVLTRQERAAALRKEAFAACAHASWTLCESKLDEAKALDPPGEQALAVQTARRMIDVARHPDASQAFPDTKEVPDAGRR